MCKVFKVSRSGYYSWLNSSPSKRSVKNEHLRDQIIKVHLNGKKAYGSPRITIELNNAGVKVSIPRVARLIKKAKIRSVVKKKIKVTTDSRHKYPIVENKLNRQFKPEKTGSASVSDITYIKTKQGWLYLTIVLDLGDRKVVGWSLSSTMKASETVVPAWKMAEKNRPVRRALIFHSDRGVQYACNEFQSLLAPNPLITKSMIRKGELLG